MFFYKRNKYFRGRYKNKNKKFNKQNLAQEANPQLKSRNLLKTFWGYEIRCNRVVHRDAKDGHGRDKLNIEITMQSKLFFNDFC